MNNIEKIEEYVPTIYVNDASPDLDETNLNKTEQAIKRVTDAANKAIDALKQLDQEKLALSAISNVLSDDTKKVPSLALANTMQRAINDLNSNFIIISNKGNVNTDWATGSADYQLMGKMCIVNALVSIKNTISIDGTLLIDGLPVSSSVITKLIHGTSGYGVFVLNGESLLVNVSPGAVSTAIFYFTLVYFIK